MFSDIYMNIDSDEDWNIVGSKNNNTKKIESKIPQKDIPLEILMTKISESLSSLKKDIVGCYIYGSRARKTNKPTSDVDLIVFLKQKYSIEELKEIKTELVSDIGLPVDFVVCIWKKKWVEHTDDRELCYFEQIKPEAICIIGTEKISYLIETSMKLGKIK